MNTIPQAQQNELQLTRLAAQRSLYSHAKIVYAWQVILSVVGVVVWSILVASYSKLAPYAALWGIVITFLDILLLTPWQQSFKEKAAKIQELFDCDVLQMDWRELKAGSRLETETVERYATKYKRKDPKYAALQEWYPESVGRVSLPLGRIICQRANCWWDADLRRHYAKLVVAFLIILTVSVSCFGFIGGFTLEKFVLAAINPLMPVFVLGIRQCKEHIESAARLDKLKDHTGKLWDKALKNEIPKELAHDSRDLQDEIYNHRRTNPLIFDWLYGRLRTGNEALMNKAADELVEEAIRR